MLARTTDIPDFAKATQMHECHRLEAAASNPEQNLLAEDAFHIAERAIDERFAKTKPEKAARMKRMLRLYVLEERTLEEVGHEFHLSRERVRRILCQARNTVRRYMVRMDRLEVSA